MGLSTRFAWSDPFRCWTKSAIDAVKQRRYSPLLLNGEPTAFIVTVTVSFNQ